ncbi:1-phosphofructokinase family hexose kinase [Aestuariibius sp. 2305UL40-4]|uniref:1-phosphofructokinase family hexose kinase n=1 Tax=Aestuariibius violaceus TaxID=3234132 RepID=UPI00345EAF6E
MTRIVTVTMNPALDVSADAPAIVPGPKLRCTDARLDPGGGGVNVSRAIRFLGGHSTALVAAGGITGDLLCELLAAEGVDVIRQPIGGLTRQSFAVLAADTGDQYRFVLPGPLWLDQEIAALFTTIEPHLTDGALIVVSGSLPPGVTPDTLIRLNRLTRQHGAGLILDTSGAALVQAVATTDTPFHVLRVDGEEADLLAGRPLDGPQDMATFGRTLLDQGKADHIVMAFGAQGTMGLSATDCFFCRPPLIQTLSAVGAGDSLVAAVTLALSRGETFRDAVRFGTAAAGAAVMTPATALCELEQTERLLPQIEVTPI